MWNIHTAICNSPLTSTLRCKWESPPWGSVSNFYHSQRFSFISSMAQDMTINVALTAVPNEKYKEIIFHTKPQWGTVYKFGFDCQPMSKLLDNGYKKNSILIGLNRTRRCTSNQFPTVPLVHTLNRKSHYYQPCRM